MLKIRKHGYIGIERKKARPQLRDDAAPGADAAQTYAGGAGRDVLPHVAQQAAALGAPQQLALEQRAIALDFDIDTVLERERNHVLRRNVKVARPDERVEARRIGEVDGWDVSLLIGARQPAELARRGVDSD